jgi:hypothetical protein
VKPSLNLLDPHKVENRKLQILYFEPPNPSASKFVRVLEPLHYLAKRGHTIISHLSLFAPGSSPAEIDETLKKCDIFLISNVDIHPHLFELFNKLVAFCNQNQILIIYDLDDYYNEVPESNPHRHATLTWEYMQTLIGKAHILTVTGRELQETLSQLHPRVLVLPNMIDFAKYPIRPRRSDRIRVGWALGVTHLEDFSVIAESIRKLQKKYSFQFVIFGLFPDFHEFVRNAKTVQQYGITANDMDDPYFKAIVKFMRDTEDIECELIPSTTYQEFPASLAALDLDVGICAIQNHRFNRCRSAIKFYQYAAVQTATVASNIYPYSDEPVVLADNNEKSWTQQLEALIVDRSFREKTTQLQYNYVIENRNYEVNSVLHETLYQQLRERVTNT